MVKKENENLRVSVRGKDFIVAIKNVRKVAY